MMPDSRACNIKEAAIVINSEWVNNQVHVCILSYNIYNIAFYISFYNVYCFYKTLGIITDLYMPAINQEIIVF